MHYGVLQVSKYIDRPADVPLRLRKERVLKRQHLKRKHF